MTEIISLADSPFEVTQKIIAEMLRAAREGTAVRVKYLPQPPPACPKKRALPEDAPFPVKASFPEDAPFPMKASFPENAPFSVKASFPEDAPFSVKAPFPEDAPFPVKASFPENAPLLNEALPIPIPRDSPSSTEGPEQSPKRARVGDGNLRDLLLRIPRDRQSWLKPEVNAADAKKFANKKFSHSLYTPAFLEWVRQVTDWIVENPAVRVVMPIAEEALGKPINTPKDRRCSGCRRFYQTQSKGVHLSFCQCRCDAFKASHCVECRVIRWACALSVDSETGQVTGLLEGDGRIRRTRCVWKSCKYAWGLDELAVLYY